MPRKKPRIEPLKSANFEVIICAEISEIERFENGVRWHETGENNWVVRDRAVGNETGPSNDWEGYYALKRVWRRSREDFDSACRFMTFRDLFSTVGIWL